MNSSSGTLVLCCGVSCDYTGSRGFRICTCSGSGDYTRERHRWLEGATVAEIMAEVARR